MRTTSHWRGGLRATLVMLLGLVVVSTGLPGSDHHVRAADADPPAFRQPAEADLEADRALVLPVEIAAPPDVVDAGPAIVAADVAFESFAADEWEIEPLVASLGTDPEDAFSFVRDSIGFEPYPGMLRGPRGTLAARAGNAYDRALLLQALLEAGGHTTRLAFADLDSARAQAVVERARQPVAHPLQDASGLIMRSDFRGSIDRRARRDYALLRPVLDPVLSATAVPGTPDPANVAAHHAWVQVLIDDAWVDYDPSMPDAQPGQPLTPAARVYDEVLPIDRQAVTLRVVAETLQDGWLSEATVLEQRVDAADAAGRRILLLFEPVEGGGDVGLIGEVGTPTEFTPTLLVDGVPVVGAPFGVASAEGGGGGFADFGGFMGDGAAGELTGLYLDAVISVPGQPDATYRRVLLDRVPAEARATDAVTPDILAPMATDEDGPLVLSGIHHVMISVGGSDPRLHAYRQGQAAYFAATELATPESAEGYDADSLLWPLTVSDASLVLASEHAIVDSISDEGARAFVGRPRVTIVSLEPDPAAPLGVAYTVDLMVDSIDLLASGDTTPADLARARVWYGTLQSALETELVIRLAPGFGAGGVVDSVSLRHDQAAAAPVLIPGSPPNGGATTAMRRALADGLLVITPDPLLSDAWWTVDPADGLTRSVLDPGLGVGRISGKGGGAPPIDPAGGASGNMGQPPGGGGKPPGPPPTPPKPPTKPMEFPDEFIPAKKPQPQGNIESQAATTEVAIPTITLLQRLKNFFRKHIGTFLTVLSVGDWIFSD